MTPEASPPSPRRNFLVPGLYEQVETRMLREQLAEAARIRTTRATV